MEGEGLSPIKEEHQDLSPKRKGPVQIDKVESVTAVKALPKLWTRVAPASWTFLKLEPRHIL